MERDNCSSFSTIMKEFGERVLLVYGGGSIRRNGIYDEAVTELHTAGKKYVELFGVEPNPSLQRWKREWRYAAGRMWMLLWQ